MSIQRKDYRSSKLSMVAGPLSPTCHHDMAQIWARWLQAQRSIAPERNHPPNQSLLTSHASAGHATSISPGKSNSAFLGDAPHQTNKGGFRWTERASRLRQTRRDKARQTNHKGTRNTGRDSCPSPTAPAAQPLPGAWDAPKLRDKSSSSACLPP